MLIHGPTRPSSPCTRLPACTHSLTHSLTSRINTPVSFPSDRKAGHADLIAPMATTTPVARSNDLNALLTLTLLVGLSACGSPSPEAPVSGPTSGSAAAVVAIPAGTAPPAPDTRRPDASRATRPASAAASAGTPPSDERAAADQAQRAARERWFAELRESPDATVRLQALEAWAQKPGTGIDPLTYALVDEDEAVRARAEELYEQQLAREEAETVL